MDYQFIWQKDVTAALAPYQWETDYLGIIYVLCDLRMQGNASFILENVLHHRWAKYTKIRLEPPMLQMGPFELPVAAFETSEWRDVIQKMLEREIIQELTAQEAEALEAEYRDSGAACAPRGAYAAGHIALSTRGKDEFRSLLDSGIFQYLFSPAYSTDKETSIQLLPEKRYRKLQEAEICEDESATESCTEQVGPFWETPFHLVSEGIGIRYPREEMNWRDYETMFRECERIPGQ